MSMLSTAVFDAALTHISSNGVEAEVQNSAGSPLVGGVTLDTGNYSSPQNNTSSAGRNMTCLVSSASDMQQIGVSTAGSAYQTAIKNSAGSNLVIASISSAPINLGASDQVNLSTFNVQLNEPT